MMNEVEEFEQRHVHVHVLVPLFVTQDLSWFWSVMITTKIFSRLLAFVCGV